MLDKESTRLRLLRLIRRYAGTDDVRILPPVGGVFHSTLIIGDRAAKVDIQNGRFSIWAYPELAGIGTVCTTEVCLEFPVRKTGAGPYIQQMLDIFFSYRMNPLPKEIVTRIENHMTMMIRWNQDPVRTTIRSYPRPTTVLCGGGGFTIHVGNLTAAERDAILATIRSFPT